MTYKIDTHSHFFSPEMAAGISKVLKANKVKEVPSAAVRSKREFLTTEERIALMDKQNVDVSTIEYQIVWQHYDVLKNSVAVRAELSAFINDKLIEARKKYPKRFFVMADMPLIDNDAAIKELKRIAKSAQGLCLNTDVHGKSLCDPQFAPFWVEANKVGLPVFLHPSSDLPPHRVFDYSYHAMIGYPIGTTLAAIDMLVTGFFDKYPNIKVQLAHTGGALPFIRKRLAMPQVQFSVGPNKMPDLLNKFYYDTAISTAHQIEFTLYEVGFNRVCWGSDYPYYTFEEGINILEGMNLTEARKEAIFNGVAKEFFGIK